MIESLETFIGEVIRFYGHNSPSTIIMRHAAIIMSHEKYNRLRWGYRWEVKHKR